MDEIDRIAAISELYEVLKKHEFEAMEGSRNSSWLCPSKQFLINILYDDEKKLELNLIILYKMHPTAGWIEERDYKIGEGKLEEFISLMVKIISDSFKKFEDFYDKYN